jgi:hypothetical protein
VPANPEAALKAAIDILSRLNTLYAYFECAGFYTEGAPRDIIRKLRVRLSPRVALKA